MGALSPYMKRVKDINSLYDFIGYVILCAPDNFPQRDYLPENEQMDLEAAFNELQDSLKYVDSLDTNKLQSLLSESHQYYKNGDEVGGAHKLQDFQNEIFKQ